MINKQRRHNDLATMDKREAADKTMNDNRNKNDALTQERRLEADKTMNENRARNDELTSIRREIKDSKNQKGTWALLVLILVLLAMSSYFIFF